MDRAVTVVALAEAMADRVVTAKEGFRNHWYLTVWCYARIENSFKMAAQEDIWQDTD